MDLIGGSQRTRVLDKSIALAKLMLVASAALLCLSGAFLGLQVAESFRAAQSEIGQLSAHANSNPQTAG